MEIEWRSYLLRPKPSPGRDLERFRAYTRSWSRPGAEPDSGSFRVWQGDAGPPSHSIPPHLAAKAAASLGEASFRRMHERLLRAYFAESRDIADRETLRSLWAEVDLPEDEFARIDDPTLLREVLAQHREALETGVTGVPAVHLAGNDAVIVGAHPSGPLSPLGRADAGPPGRAAVELMVRGDTLFRLDGRVAVVTGASSGLGATFATGLAQAGARVVLAARRADRLDALAKRLTESSAEVVAIACDVSDEAEVDRLVAATRDRFGGVDVLLNNAGITEIGAAEAEPLAVFERVLAVNLTGAFLCAQRFGRIMIEAGGGSIVNVASVLGLVGTGQVPQASYAASKGGLVNLTRELAAQWARKGVRVNALAPAWFESEMTAEMFTDERSMRWVRDRTPMGRPGREDELVGPLLFLASDASSYVTGHVLTVDGGWTIV